MDYTKIINIIRNKINRVQIFEAPLSRTNLILNPIFCAIAAVSWTSAPLRFPGLGTTNGGVPKRDTVMDLDDDAKGESRISKSKVAAWKDISRVGCPKGGQEGFYVLGKVSDAAKKAAAKGVTSIVF